MITSPGKPGKLHCTHCGSKKCSRYWIMGRVSLTKGYCKVCFRLFDLDAPPKKIPQKNITI